MKITRTFSLSPEAYEIIRKYADEKTIGNCSLALEMILREWKKGENNGIEI